MRSLIALVAFFVPLTLSDSAAWGNLIGYLTESRVAGSDHFESDFYLTGTADFVDAAIELINLDIANSMVGDAPLADFSRVTFAPAARFDPWDDGSQFGSTPGFESQISIDAFASPAAVNYVIDDEVPFRVGTLRFRVAGIALRSGETVRLDISGRDDGSSSRTTSVAIRGTDGITRLVDPQFNSPLGSAVAQYPPVVAIPEPATVCLLVAIGILLGSSRTRRR